MFAELAGLPSGAKLMVVTGSATMIAGAVAVSRAAPPPSEMENWRAAMRRECSRYGLDEENVAAVMVGGDSQAGQNHQRLWWETLIVAAAVTVFAGLAAGTHAQPIRLNLPWMLALIAGTLLTVVWCGWLLWRRTRFS